LALAGRAALLGRAAAAGCLLLIIRPNSSDLYPYGNKPPLRPAKSAPRPAGKRLDSDTFHRYNIKTGAARRAAQLLLFKEKTGYGKRDRCYPRGSEKAGGRTEQPAHRQAQ